MADIEIAVGIFRAWVVGVLWQARSVSEIPVCAHVIERVRVGVTGHHAQAMIVSGVQGYLQTVVIGPIDVAHLENVAQIGELRVEGLIRDLIPREGIIVGSTVVVSGGSAV